MGNRLRARASHPPSYVSCADQLGRAFIEQFGTPQERDGSGLHHLARSDREGFDCAAWMHKARSLPRDEFKREVDKHLTGKDSEPTEVICFKLYRSQIPVVEQAIETAAMMLGSDKSRGYCLEMICADFLAGANLDKGDPEILLKSVTRLYQFLPGEQKHEFLTGARAEIA